MTLRTICILTGLATCVVGATFATVKRASTIGPWNPPKTSLPSSFVDAVAFAFDHGVPDPRGGGVPRSDDSR